MVQQLVGIVLVLIASGHSLAEEPLPLPKDVPPMLGTAVVCDPGKEGDSEWKIQLTLPKVAWEVVGEMVPKKTWPELKTEVKKATLTLRMGGPSQLAPSKIVGLKGKELNRDVVLKRLGKEAPVLVSVSGRMPDSYYLQLTNPEALVVILGARDGYPAPDLLPAKKAATIKPNTGGDK